MVIVKLGFASMNLTTYSYEKIIIYVMKRLFFYTVYAVNICIKNVDWLCMPSVILFASACVRKRIK